MPMQLPRSLYEYRLVIVTGKGGTGKTTVAAALALAAQREGLRVMVAELGHGEHLPSLLSDRRDPVGYAGRELLPGLTAIHIDPFEALCEYMELQFRVRTPIEMVLRNKGFRQLLEGAPGWRELITLGKLWHLEQMTLDDGRPTYDLIVVDAPATGHGVTFLDVPRVVASAVKGGPLHRNSERVEELIRDPERTLVLPVALPEELPARESIELVTRVREEVGVEVNRIVINKIVAPPFPEGLEALPQLLEELPADRSLGLLPPSRELSRCASLLLSRYELSRSYVELIGNETALPVIPLPDLDAGPEESHAMDQLAHAVAASCRELSSTFSGAAAALAAHQGSQLSA